MAAGHPPLPGGAGLWLCSSWSPPRWVTSWVPSLYALEGAEGRPGARPGRRSFPGHRCASPPGAVSCQFSIIGTLDD